MREQHRLFDYEVDLDKCEVEIFPATYRGVCEIYENCYCEGSGDPPCMAYTLGDIATAVFVKLLCNRNRSGKNVQTIQKMRSTVLSLKGTRIVSPVVVLAVDHES